MLYYAYLENGGDNMFQSAEAVIFDMDGTIIDSMWVWRRIDVEYLNSKGFEVPEDLKDIIEKMSYEEVAKYFKKRFDIKDSTDKIIEDWNNMAFHHYKYNVPLKKGALEFIKALKHKGFKIGLATSNCMLLVEAALKSNGIYDYFDTITFTDEVKVEKDHPDVYLLCAKRLQTLPEKCIVFEDILPAVNGAKLAGMKVVGVMDEYNKDQKEGILCSSDLFINDYTELFDAV